MSRTSNTRLDTKTARAKLAVKERPFKSPYTCTIAPRRQLGYARLPFGAGHWIALVEIGRTETGSAIRRQKDIGVADDIAPADGENVLSYQQALSRASAWEPEDSAKRRGKMTVRQAIESYLAAKRAADGDYAADDAQQKIRLHVLKEDAKGKPLDGERGFGDRAVGELSLTELRKWRDATVKGRSKETVNRVIAVFKAALNHAYADEENGIESDAAWRRLESFEKQNGERTRREDHFSEPEALALIEAARKIDQYFGDLCEAAFHTGARAPGELAGLDVRHFNAKKGTLAIIEGKTGPRTTTLSSEGIEFFEKLTEGRKPSDILLPCAEGERWQKSMQHRRIKAALKAADLPRTASLYSFRHSHISRAIERGMPLLVLAENVGTSVAMIESNYAHLLAEKRRELIEQHSPRLRVVTGRKAA